jgi:hypothetical protein
MSSDNDSSEADYAYSDQEEEEDNQMNDDEEEQDNDDDDDVNYCEDDDDYDEYEPMEYETENPNAAPILKGKYIPGTIRLDLVGW